MSRDPETSAASSPRISTPSRRTILTGAAWSVPVIAAASVAPIAAAASNDPVLAFNQTTYNGTACGTITGAYVTVTVGGVPTAGQSVTVTLSGGYTFSGGSTTHTGVSDGSGKVALPAISVAAVGGSGTLSGISGTSTASATATAPAVRAIGLDWSSTYFPAVPAGIAASSVGFANTNSNSFGYFLGSDGYLYKSFDAGAWAKCSPSGVTGFSLDTTGTTALYTTGTTIGLDWSSTYFPALPAGITATSVGFTTSGGNYFGYFLGSDGYLYKSFNAGAWTKCSPAGVTDFSVDTVSSSAIYTTGTTIGLDWSSTYFPALPAGITATSVGFTTSGGNYFGYFLGSDGYLYKSFNAGAWTKCSPAGVTDFSVDTTGSSAIYTTGTAIGIDWSSTYYPALPAGVTADSVGLTSSGGNNFGYFLGSDGYLYKSFNAGPWTKSSPAGVTAFSVDTISSSAIYSLNATGC